MKLKKNCVIELAESSNDDDKDNLLAFLSDQKIEAVDQVWCTHQTTADHGYAGD